MNDWQALRDTTGILSLLRAAEELGVAEERVLLGTQIRVENLERPFATVNHEAVLAQGLAQLFEAEAGREHRNQRHEHGGTHHPSMIPGDSGSL